MSYLLLRTHLTMCPQRNVIIMSRVNELYHISRLYGMNLIVTACQAKMKLKVLVWT